MQCKQEETIMAIKIFLQGSRFKIENQRDFEALPEEKMDAWVRKATKFSSWQEMLDTATDKYVMHKNL